MSESFIQLPPDSSGKRARSIARTINSTLVFEEVMLIADPTNGDLVPIASQPTLNSINTNVANYTGTPNATPPSAGVVLLGFDSSGGELRRVLTDSSGKMIITLL